jgi:hypothetical protein
MAKPDRPKLAVLIDSDNAPAALAKELLDEISKYGTANVKRAYGDWTTPNLRGWKEHLHKHAIQPIQQFRYIDGKNSTDSALIIDAMDLLHLGEFDGFCIVSSDSDFTRLATRLREAGKQVIGLGEKAKAAAAFVSACDKFVYLELLSAVEGTVEAAKVADTHELRGLLNSAIASATRDDGWAALSAVGGLIGNTKPDFDPRSYGFSKLSELVRAQSFVEVKESPDAQGNIHLRVRLRSTGTAGKPG